MATCDCAPELRPSSSPEQATSYEAVVFRQMPDTDDFSCSTQIVLPGRHTAADAWAVVRQAVLPSGERIIGGENSATR